MDVTVPAVRVLEPSLAVKTPKESLAKTVESLRIKGPSIRETKALSI